MEPGMKRGLQKLSPGVLEQGDLRSVAELQQLTTHVEVLNWRALIKLLSIVCKFSDAFVWAACANRPGSCRPADSRSLDERLVYSRAPAGIAAATGEAA
jgi:hypothetical protein